MTSLIPIQNLGMLYVNDLQISNNATTPDTKLDVAAGQCRDSTDVTDIQLDEAVTIDASVNGANGLDTGTFAASTWYAVHIIADSTNRQPVAALISTSRTAPTLPFEYDVFRHIGWALTDGSVHFLKFYQFGNNSLRKYFWDAAVQVLDDGDAETLTAISLAAAIPPQNLLPVGLRVDFTPATADDKVSFAPFGSTSTVLPGVSGVVAAKVQVGELEVISKLDSATPKILYINSAASCNTDVFVTGFTYSL